MAHSDRKLYEKKIFERIGDRSLIWIGSRGCDVTPLLKMKQLKAVFSIISPMATFGIEDICYESLTGKRVDLDAYSIDDDYSEAAVVLRKKLFDILDDNFVAIAYRPLRFFASIYYPRKKYIDYLGLFHQHQHPFEHKIWVETELKKFGVPVMPWQYRTNMDNPKNLINEQLESGPIVIRLNNSSGGNGLFLITNLDEFLELWERLSIHQEGYYSVAPYLYPSLPINLNCTVFKNGIVTLHGASVQIIGDPLLTNLKFGFCGNDYEKIKELDPVIIVKLEDMARRTGKWLASAGYIGAFGIDALLLKDDVFLTEINPRFQGSSTLSSKVDDEAERPNIFQTHMGAFFDIFPPKEISLSEIINSQPAVSQIICHNISGVNEQVCISAGIMDQSDFKLGVIPEPNVIIQPNGVRCRITTYKSVADNLGKLEASKEIGLKEINNYIKSSKNGRLQ